MMDAIESGLLDANEQLLRKLDELRSSRADATWIVGSAAFTELIRLCVPSSPVIHQTYDPDIHRSPLTVCGVKVIRSPHVPPNYCRPALWLDQPYEINGHVGR